MLRRGYVELAHSMKGIPEVTGQYIERISCCMTVSSIYMDGI